MAVGKGSMERAAKTAEKAQAAVKKEQAAETAAKTKKAPAKKTAKPKAAAVTIAAPAEEVMEKIVYQTSDGMLERDAEPNERFGVGDAMPVYYF